MHHVTFWYIRLYINIVHGISPFSVKYSLLLNYNADLSNITGNLLGNFMLRKN